MKRKRLKSSSAILKCKICKKPYLSKVGLTNHEARHTNRTNAFKCRSCQRDFSSKEYLKIHIRRSHKTIANDFICNVCDKAFKSKQTLSGHHEIQHGEKGDLLSCDVCDKKFLNKHTLQAHLPKHEAFKTYPCPKCEQRFKYAHSRNHHVSTVHSEIRHHACLICEKSFKTKYGLKNHMNLHSQALPLTCDYSGCGKKFKSEQILKAHKRTCHTKDTLKKFSCHACDKTFAVLRDLNRHILKHTGKRPYMCGLCDKSFSRKDYLPVHYRKKHGPEDTST